MTASPSASADRLNDCLARLLAIGTWASCGLVLAGMLMPAMGVSEHVSNAYVVSTGIILLIALPVMRVAAMGLWFLLHNDRDFALIAALVLAIIVASTLFGTAAG